MSTSSWPSTVSLPWRTLGTSATFSASLSPTRLLVCFSPNRSIMPRFWTVTAWAQACLPQPPSIPCPRSPHITCSHVSDPTEYHSLVGALQYLTFTRSDIAYVI
jgi:hypothetical protein